MVKLLKYNILNFWKKHLLVILIIVINLGVWKVLDLLVNRDDLNESLLAVIMWFSMLTNIILIFSLIALPVVTMLLAIFRYKKKVLGDEGYLTHTLPVKKRDILDASILNLLIFLLIDLIIILLVVTLRFGVAEVTRFINLLVSNNVLQVFSMVAIFVITFVTFFNQVVLALTLGYSKETNKVKNTIIFGVIIYVANQVLGSIWVGILFLIAFFTKIEMLNILLLVVPLIYLLLFIATYLLIDNSLNKKLNLE